MSEAQIIRSYPGRGRIGDNSHGMTRRLMVFGPNFNLPDPSSFCMKANALLQMAGVPFELAVGNLLKSPKKKLPVLVENDEIIADSTLIRFHLEKTLNIDFDEGLSAASKGHAWALEKLCEDNLYWAIVADRWCEQANFERGPKRFFEHVPAPIRPIISAVVRRSVRKQLHGQGFGRHDRWDRHRIARRGIEALAGALGDKDWMCGPAPCGADTSIHAVISALLSDHFESDLKLYTEQYDNLVAYRDRGFALWYPEFADAPVAGAA